MNIYEISNKSTDGVPKKFKIIAGQEYQLSIIDETTNMQEDFFYYVYCDAFKEVDKIIKENNNKFGNLLETANNIIAFCGERGQGKSSAMLSFSKLLSNIGSKHVENDFNDYVQNISNYNFHVLSRIDPTELENQQSILSVIISRIFSDFKDYIIKNPQYNIEEKNKLLDAFQKCFRDINHIKNSNIKSDLYEDDLEILSSMSDGTYIKRDFFNLVELFLSFMNNNSRNEGKLNYLVIQVDDTDLNVNNAYGIVEDIRKYFMIPKVVVLMATKPDQLALAIEQEYMRSFIVLAKSNEIENKDFRHMASKYVNKLIPGSRRINLPDILDFDTNSRLGGLGLKYTGYDKYDKPITIIDSKFLQSAVLKYIYEKTGLIFIEPKGYTNNIIPRNARSMANFMSVLYSMEDIKRVSSFEELSNEDIELRFKNLDIFEDYFINTWIEENVEGNLHSTIKEWYNSSWKTKNKLLLYYISKDIICILDKDAKSLYRSKFNNKSTEIIKYYDKKYKNKKIAFSDVLGVLNRLDSYYPTTRCYSFTFAIRTLYGININKFMLNQILYERENHSKCIDIAHDYFKIKPDKRYKKNIDIVNFIGDIFGENINAFFPKKDSRFDYAKFSTWYTNEQYYETTRKIYKSNFEQFAQDVFGYFVTDSNDYSNRVSPAHYHFDISLPLVKLLNPYCYNGLERKFLSEKQNDINKELASMRYACFNLISNPDVVHKVETHWREINTVVENENFVKFINEVYLDLFSYLSEITYDSTNGIRHITTFIEYSHEWLNSIFENRYKNYNRLIISYINQLNEYDHTVSISLLDARVLETHNLFKEIDVIEGLDDISFEIRELSDVLSKLKKKKINKNECLTYEKRINKYRDSVKGKLQKLLESNTEE